MNLSLYVLFLLLVWYKYGNKTLSSKNIINKLTGVLMIVLLISGTVGIIYEAYIRP